MKSFFSKLFALYVVRKIKKDSKRAVSVQLNLLQELTHKASRTAFGNDHSFNDIHNYKDFTNLVPIRDYEGLASYIDRIRKGERDVLWRGLPLYLSKTSGTTSGSKFIPITIDSIQHHIDTARNALLCYINETGNADFVKGKMIFLQGSPEMKSHQGMRIGRLSGIVAHHVPRYLQKNRLPSLKVNIIDDWESKVKAIVNETIKENMTLISGIPPWVQMYFELLLEKSGKKTVAEIFPNFSLLVYGGVNFKPYQNKIEHLVGKNIDKIELYPASEGFIAFQDSQQSEGMLLNTNSGIFYEFVEAEQISNETPKRLHLGEVELNVNYAIVLSNNAGLWAYNIGDTIKFVSLDPYRIVVTGRVKHFTSAFGEHVIAEEVEGAIEFICAELNMEISEFHVAPVVNPNEGVLPHHEWLIEYDVKTVDKKSLENQLDQYMQNRNHYYRDLREGKVLKELIVSTVKFNGFNAYLKSMGKLGGQNKLPRLSNDRKLADAMFKYLLNE